MSDFYNPLQRASEDIERTRRTITENPLQGAANQIGAEQQKQQAQRDAHPDLPPMASWDYDLYDKILPAVEASENPEETRERFNAAMLYAKIFDKPITDTYQNLESYNQAWLGKSFTPKTDVKAIVDSYSMGVASIKYSGLGSKLKAMGGSDPETEAEIAELQNQIFKLQDNMPRSWAIDAVKSAAQSLPYTFAASVAGIATAGLGSAMVGTAGGTASVMAAVKAGASIVGSGAASYAMMEGAEYLDLRAQGVRHDIAAPVSSISALIQAGIEASLGNVAGAVAKIGKTGTQTITGAVAKKLFVSGRTGALAKALMGYAGEAIEEGTEEVLQGFTSAAALEISSRLQKEGVQTKDADQVGQEAMENFKGGFLASLILGVPGTVAEGRATAKEARRVADLARSFDEKTFTEEAAKMDLSMFSGMDEAQKKETLSAIWKAQQERAGKPAKSSKPIDEKVVDMTGPSIARPGPARRLDDGALYVKAVDKGTGEGLVEEAKLQIGDPKSGTKYGEVRYRIDGDTVLVDTVSAAQYLTDRSEVIHDAIVELGAQHPGMNVEWNTSDPELEGIRDRIVSENPRGKSSGLQWFETNSDLKETRRAAVVGKVIKENFKNLSSQDVHTATTMVYESARSLGFRPEDVVGRSLELTTKKRIEENPEIASQLAEARQGMAAAQQEAGGTLFMKDGQIMGLKSAAKEFERGVKAVIYAAENANLSTFAHEWFHFIDVAYIGRSESHRKMFEQAMGKRYDDLTAEDRESLAYGYEKYLKDGSAPSEELAGLFRRIARAMAKVISAIGKSMTISPDLKKAYDSLFSEGSQLAEDVRTEAVGKGPGTHEAENGAKIDAKAKKDTSGKTDAPTGQKIAFQKDADESGIVNPIDRTLSQEEKVNELEKLSAENERIITPILKEIDQKLGTESKFSYKEHAKILSKANRPSIKDVKPWFDVEHIRDSFRFKTIINTLEDVSSAFEILMDHGLEVVKVDTAKFITPKEWGWRFASFDFRMPNGQLVEWYIPLKELEQAKKDGNHALFEKWRNKTEEEKFLERKEFQADLEASFYRYMSAFQAAAERLGLSETAISASWKKVEAEVVSVTRSKLSLRSSAEGTPRVQEPFFNTTENFSQDTQTLPSDGSLETKNSDILPSASSIDDKGILFQTDTLPEQEKIPETGTYPAVMTDDGGLYVDTKGYGTHVLFIQAKKIPVSRIISGGWLDEGVYNASDRSDTMRYVERELAKRRVAEKRAKRSDPRILFQASEVQHISKEEAAEILTRNKPVPEGWYVHGRGHGNKFINNEWPTQFTKDIEVAVSYGKGGEVWMAKPLDDATVLDFEGMRTQDMNRFMSNMKQVHEWYKKEMLDSEIMESYSAVLEAISFNRNVQIDELEWNDIEKTLRDEYTPENIVVTAKAYDSLDFINLLQFSITTESEWPDFIKTPDGAVLLPGSDKVVAVNLTEDAGDDPRILFQLTDPEIDAEARTFDTWEEWRDYVEAMDGQSKPEGGADDAWYKARWEQAYNIVRDEKGQEIDQTPELTTEEIDERFIARMKEEGELERFLEAIQESRENDYEYGPVDEEEALAREEAQALMARIEEAHPTVLNNAVRVSMGRNLTPTARKSILSLMERGARLYRSLYVDVTGDAEFAALSEREIDTLPEIRDTDDRPLSIVERMKMVNSIKSERVRKELMTGDLVPDNVRFLIGQLDEVKADLQSKLRAAEKEIDEDRRTFTRQEEIFVSQREKIDELQKTIAKSEREVERTQKKLDQVRAREKSGKGAEKERRAKLSASYDAKIAKLKESIAEQRQELKDLRSASRDAMASARAEASMQKKQALEKLKDQIREKEEERREAAKIIAYKRKIVTQIMAKPSNEIWYEDAEKIRAIQRTVDPKARAATVKWAGETYEIQAFREKAITEDLIDILPKSLVNRLFKKSLDEWTVSELEEMRDEIDRLKSVGRTTWGLKEAERKYATGKSRKIAINQHMADPKLENAAAAGSKERRDQLKKLDNGFKKIATVTWTLPRIADWLDGGKPGAHTRLLVTEERAAYKAKMDNYDRRTKKIFDLMKRKGIDARSLYEKEHTIAGVGPAGGDVTLTTSDIMYLMIGLRDPNTKAAITYGNMMDQSERSDWDNQTLEVMGREKVQALEQSVNEKLTDAEREIAEAIGADFRDEFGRLDDIFLNEFNLRMKQVNSYVPMIRSDVTASGGQHEEAQANELLNVAGVSIKRTPDKGFTASRIKISPRNQRAIKLDLYGTWMDAVERQEHFAAYTRYIRKLNGVYKTTMNSDSRLLRHLITQTHGAEVLMRVDQEINALANPHSFRDDRNVDRLVRTLRGNLGSAYLAWKTSSVLKQLVTSPAPYLAYVSPLDMASSAFELMQSGKNEEIKSKSAIMRHRVANPIIEAIKIAQKNGKGKKGIATIQGLGMKGLELADWVSVATGWNAVYKKALYEGATEEEAVVRADDITLKCQPSAREQDLAPLFKTGSEGFKIITQFQTALNVIWNQLSYDLPTAVKNKEWGFVVRMVSAYAIAGIGLGLLTEGLKGDDDTDDLWYKRFMYWSMSQAFDSVPLIGSGVSAVARQAITGEKRHFYASSVFPAADELISAAGKASSGDWDKAAKDFAEGIGIGLGLPVSGVKEAVNVPENPGRLMGRR